MGPKRDKNKQINKMFVLKSSFGLLLKAFATCYVVSIARCTLKALKDQPQVIFEDKQKKSLFMGSLKKGRGMTNAGEEMMCLIP